MEKYSVLVREILIGCVVFAFLTCAYVMEYSGYDSQSESENMSRDRSIHLKTFTVDGEILNVTTSQDGNGGLLEKRIDLDISVPTVDEIYDKLVLITAFSDNHYKEAMGYIGTAQRHMPGKRIIVYNLGLSDSNIRKVGNLCGVEIREFHFNKYPKHVKSLGSFAWKPIIINLALNEFGAVYYGDASIRFKKSIKELLPGIERHHGYMTNILKFDPTENHHYKRTVPAMFVKLGVNRKEYHNCKNCAPHVQPGTQLIVNSTTIQKKLMRPWLQCALEKDCITPPGSNRQNHRQDASAISLLVYKNLFGEWTEQDNDTEKMQSVLYVNRGTNDIKRQPRNC